MKKVYIYDFERRNETYTWNLIWVFFFTLFDNPIYAQTLELHLYFIGKINFLECQGRHQGLKQANYALCH